MTYEEITAFFDKADEESESLRENDITLFAVVRSDGMGGTLCAIGRGEELVRAYTDALVELCNEEQSLKADVLLRVIPHLISELDLKEIAGDCLRLKTLG